MEKEWASSRSCSDDFLMGLLHVSNGTLIIIDETMVPPGGLQCSEKGIFMLNVFNTFVYFISIHSPWN